MSDVCIMEVMNSYESIRSFIIRSSSDISNIETVKKRFKLSKRKLDFVTNVAILIKILEKLGELDSFRIHPIEIINENLDNGALKNDLQHRIRAHKSLISKCSIPEHSVNLYANDVLVRENDSLSQTEDRNPSNLSGTCNGSSGVQNQAFKQVIDHISLKIGMRWKEFARYINMEEEEIEEIDDCPRLNQREKARKCLNLLLKKENPDSAKTIIIEALKKSRRNDIRKQIEPMF